jgi:peptide chain release factor 2
VNAEVKTRLRAIEELLDRIRDATRHDDQKKRLAKLEDEMSAVDFWNNREAAEATIDKMKKVKESVQSIEKLASKLEDTRALHELAEADKDGESLAEAEKDSVRLLKEAEGLELRTLLGGKYASANAYLEIQSGAGGTDACDWTLMVQRMYLRWAEQQKFKTRIIDEQFAEEAGLKSSTIHIVGNFAYGYLKSESGVHRIVRISPFDAQSRRQTAFASVRVIPARLEHASPSAIHSRFGAFQG